MLSLVAIALHVLAMDVTFNLILAKPKWQVKLEGLIVLTGLRFLEAGMVRISCCARATLSRSAWILRPVVIRRTICSGCGRRWEEACLSTSFVRSLVHLGFDIGWLSNRVGQLDDQIIIKVVLIRRL